VRPVPAPLRTALGVLRSRQSDELRVEADRATARVPGGPAYAHGARYVEPGVYGGRVFIVPVPVTNAGTAGTGPGACLVTVGGPRFDPASFCASTRLIARASAFMSADVPAADELAEELRSAPKALRRGSFVKLIVPDGVARVRLRYRDGETESATVRNNVVVVHTRQGAPAAIHARMDLLGADGRNVRPTR
jgi:hypothetical protein